MSDKTTAMDTTAYHTQQNTEMEDGTLLRQFEEMQ